MNEERARAVTLLQAFETARPASLNWNDDDRAWATRLAQDDLPADAAHELFVTRRATHALQRLTPREPAVARWLSQRLWRPRWTLWAALLGFVVGIAADSIGSSQRINLLAPPLWTVVVWNVLVYVGLLVHALLGLAKRQRPPGRIVRWTERLMRIGRGLPGLAANRAAARNPASGSGQALADFAALWLRRSAPLSAARAASLLHAAAAALAIGLIAGLYLRGLALDYRAGWQSTFLDAGAAHAVLHTLLAPASFVSGIAIPDVAAFAAMRLAQGGQVGSDVGTIVGNTAIGAPAAPWIHLLALTLALVVVLPRVALAAWSGVRSRWLEAHFGVPIGDPYFQQLLRQQTGDVARVVVLPYASTPTAQAALGLQALLSPTLGSGLQLRILPTVPFGAEDEADGPLALDTTLVIALFDLVATPEAENHARFARRLAARAPAGAATIALIDETAFAQRFGAASARLQQRQQAWRAWAEPLGSAPLFASLDAPDPFVATPALQLAMRRPIGWQASEVAR